MQKALHSLVQRGNSLVVTVNPVNLVCSAKSPEIHDASRLDLQSQTSLAEMNWISLSIFELRLAILSDSCILKCS